MKEITLKKIDCEHLLGQFLDETHYDTLIDESCDVYLDSPMDDVPFNSEHNVVLMFRKNYFPAEEQAGAYDGLKEAAVPSQNRGLAAGPKGEKCSNREWVTGEQLYFLKQLSLLSDTDSEDTKVTSDDFDRWRLLAKQESASRGLVWLSSEREKFNFSFDEWINSVYTKPNAQIKKEVTWIEDTFISDTTYANMVDSGIAGWFDRYPRIPYGRATAYTAQNYDKFKKAFPFLKELSQAFKYFLPKRYAAQKAHIDALDPSFYVPESVFTTITVNKNFRTAAHRDAGDLTVGFSNLTVVAKNNDYSGGYLIIPELRAAVNIRPGDLLLINNHEYIHGNTPIVSANPDPQDFERISLVCYFREEMKNLGTREYEDLRYAFVEDRRKNKDHPLWREKWNGVSQGMWDNQEWYDYIKTNGKPYMLEKYHPEALNTGNLEDLLFG